ncbi:hypothetical protein QBC44DRAFT_303521 [Cladorrhinum sp. PSN332]|nr:hypothetical protein QBC44DRAFT_303521 [Cladorrhinum sp. PSN332]
MLSLFMAASVLEAMTSVILGKSRESGGVSYVLNTGKHKTHTQTIDLAMETISHYATAATHAATKAIWGEQPNEQEPVNGRMGNVAAGEPYDAGNIESSSTALKTTTPNPEIGQPQASHAEKSKDDAAKEFNTSANPLAQKVALPAPTPSERQQQKPPSPPPTPKDVTHNKPNPSATLPSSTLPEDSTKSQNDTRSPSNPSTRPDADGDDQKPDALDANNNPVRINGPGPKSLEELARERGGGAGAGAVSSTSTSSSKSSNGNVVGGGHELETKRTGESDGTGELWVKSTGLAADGGDFDASKPGAGREADRLLEQKGIHHSEAQRAGEAGEKKHHHLFGGGGKEGPGLREKIKAKLHRGD